MRANRQVSDCLRVESFFSVKTEGTGSSRFQGWGNFIEIEFPSSPLEKRVESGVVVVGYTKEKASERTRESINVCRTWVIDFRSP